MSNLFGKARAEEQSPSSAAPILTGGDTTVGSAMPTPSAAGAARVLSGVPASDPLDYTERYNTRLSAEDEKKFQDWTKKQSERTGRNIADDTYDYDLRGWWQEHRDADLTTGVHLNDKYKKPNHPTFSTESQYSGSGGNEGGRWEKTESGAWRFVAGRTNLRNRSPARLRAYFDRVESGNDLVIPDALYQDVAGAP